MQKNKITVDSFNITFNNNDPLYLEIECITKINITVKARDSICNQGIEKYLFTGAFYIMTEVEYGYNQFGWCGKHI